MRRCRIFFGRTVKVNGSQLKVEISSSSPPICPWSLSIPPWSIYFCTLGNHPPSVGGFDLFFESEDCSYFCLTCRRRRDNLRISCQSSKCILPMSICIPVEKLSRFGEDNVSRSSAALCNRPKNLGCSWGMRHETCFPHISPSLPLLWDPTTSRQLDSPKRRRRKDRERLDKFQMSLQRMPPRLVQDKMQTLEWQYLEGRNSTTKNLQGRRSVTKRYFILEIPQAWFLERIQTVAKFLPDN